MDIQIHNIGSYISQQLSSRNTRGLDCRRYRLSGRRAGIYKALYPPCAARQAQLHIPHPRPRRPRGLSWRTAGANTGAGYPAPCGRNPLAGRAQCRAARRGVFFASRAAVQLDKKEFYICAGGTGGKSDICFRRAGSGIRGYGAAHPHAIPARTYSGLHRAAAHTNGGVALRGRGHERRYQRGETYHLD